MGGLHIGSGDQCVGSATLNTWMHTHASAPPLQLFARTHALRRRDAPPRRAGAADARCGAWEVCTLRRETNAFGRLTPHECAHIRAPRRCSCVHPLRRRDAQPLLRDCDARERPTRGAAHGWVAHCVGRRVSRSRGHAQAAVRACATRACKQTTATAACMNACAPHPPHPHPPTHRAHLRCKSGMIY